MKDETPSALYCIAEHYPIVYVLYKYTYLYTWMCLYARGIIWVWWRSWGRVFRHGWQGRTEYAEYDYGKHVIMPGIHIVTEFIHLLWQEVDGARLLVEFSVPLQPGLHHGYIQMFRALSLFVSFCLYAAPISLAALSHYVDAELCIASTESMYNYRLCIVSSIGNLVDQFPSAHS